MIRLLYTSKATFPSGQRADFDILDAAIKFNTDADITGYLIRTDNRYVQILEGPEATVDDLLERIKTDKRNKDLRVLLRDPITRRNFLDWSMGFKILSPTEAQDYDLVDQMSDEEARELVPLIYNIATANRGVVRLG